MTTPPQRLPGQSAPSRFIIGSLHRSAFTESVRRQSRFARAPLLLQLLQLCAHVDVQVRQLGAHVDHPFLAVDRVSRREVLVEPRLDLRRTVSPRGYTESNPEPIALDDAELGLAAAVSTAELVVVDPLEAEHERAGSTAIWAVPDESLQLTVEPERDEAGLEHWMETPAKRSTGQRTAGGLYLQRQLQRHQGTRTGMKTRSHFTRLLLLQHSTGAGASQADAPCRRCWRAGCSPNRPRPRSAGDGPFGRAPRARSRDSPRRSN